MDVAVGATATLDILVEFFTGVLEPTTGVASPKPPRDRYLQPPHALLFNVLVNPALRLVHDALLTLAGCGNPLILYRLVVCLQPVVQHAEAWAAPRAAGRRSAA